MTSPYKVRRRPWPKLPFKSVAVGVVLLLAVVLVVVLLPGGRRFDGFAMHGGPVVLATVSQPRIVALTSHWEYKTLTRGRSISSKTIISYLHYDLWAFDATDLTRTWITRVSTIKRGQRDIGARILGVVDSTIWLYADELLAVRVGDGRVIGDAAVIEARNPPLRGVMPTAHNRLLFDGGLVIVAADGERWRIDGATLLATREAVTAPLRRSAVGGITAPAVVTSAAAKGQIFHALALATQNQYYKTRSFVAGDTWFGMMHPSEVEQITRDPMTQAFGQALRYRLWSAPLRDTLDRFGNPRRVPVGYTPLPNSPEFLEGGLLSLPVRGGGQRVVGIANPTRFIIVHQDRVDAAGTQTLTCVGLDGHVCWNAPLQMSIATGFAMLSAGPPESWALIVIGLDPIPPAANARDPRRDRAVSFGRVAIRDGRVTRISFADYDLAALADDLKPYRSR